MALYKRHADLNNEFNERSGSRVPESTTQPVQPHQDLSAEKAVLAAMLNSPEAIADLVELVEPDDFYRPGHILIYTAILGLYAKGEQVDAATVSAELTRQGDIDKAGGQGYLITLATTTSRGKIRAKEAQSVRAMAVLRRTKAAAEHIEDLVADGTAENVERIADTAQAEIFAATSHPGGLPPAYPFPEVLEVTLDELEAVGSSGGQIVGVPTGFADLDSLTNGWRPGQLIVIAGRPAMGKSTLASDFLRAASVHHQLPSVLFTLESSRTEVAMRVLAAEARIPLHNMRSGSLTDGHWNTLARHIAHVTNAPLYIQDGAYANLTDLRARCRRLVAQHNIQLIVVDDLHMLTYGTRPFASRYEEISEISRGLKLLAKQLEVPVVAVSQLNRGPEQRSDKKPHLSDLRDSGALEDNADLVILLHREDAYERETPRAGEADLIIAKHRFGPLAKITLGHQGAYGRFLDMA